MNVPLTFMSRTWSIATMAKDIALMVSAQQSTVWGHKAKAADEACYIKFNVLGTQSGNCGAKKYAPGFKPCERE